MIKNYYRILELPENCNQEQIKKAYRKLAMQHHPDKNPNRKEEAKEKFTQIAEAYAVLSDPQKRAAYDRDGDTTEQQYSQPQPPTYSRNQYAWKNPEFDPNFDHFANMPEHLKNLGMQPPFKFFEGIKDCQMFSSHTWFNDHFGSFTFEMAEEVFDKSFKNFEQQYTYLLCRVHMLPSHQMIGGQKSISSPQTSNELAPREGQWGSFQNVKDYQPKNSTLLEEKVIQRNGRRVLVKKFSVTQNGKTHKQVRESFL